MKIIVILFIALLSMCNQPNPVNPVQPAIDRQPKIIECKAGFQFSQTIINVPASTVMIQVYVRIHRLSEVYRVLPCAFLTSDFHEIFLYYEYFDGILNIRYDSQVFPMNDSLDFRIVLF